MLNLLHLSSTENFFLLKTEFDNRSIQQTKQLFFKSKQKFCEHGEKAGKPLAHQIRQSAAVSIIPEIQTELGEITTNPNAINDEFKILYFDSFRIRAAG